MTLISDPENPDFCEECPHSLDIHCDRCDSLDSNFRDILKRIDDLVINNETRARINLENKECSRALHAWKAHLLRSVTESRGSKTERSYSACLKQKTLNMPDYHGLGDEISAAALQGADV